MNSDVGGTLKYIITGDADQLFQTLDKVRKATDDLAGNVGTSSAKAGSALKNKMGDGASEASRQFRKFVDDSVAGLAEVTSAIGKISFDAFTTAAGMASTAMAGMVSKGINIGSSLEKNRLSFEALTGSVQGAEKVLTSVADFASENPYQLLDVSNVARELVAMGRSADQVEGDLAKLGAIGVATGADLQGLGHVYGQISAQGKMMTQDMYQLVNQGVAIMPALAKVTGKSMTELKDYISDGKVTMEVFEEALTQVVDPAMYDNLLKKMNNTIPRQLDRLKGSISTFATSLVGIDKWTGQKLETGLAQTYTDILKKLADNLRNSELIKAVQKFGQKLAEAVNKFVPLLDKIAPVLTKIFNTLSDNMGMMLPIVGGALVMFGKLGSSLPVIGPLFNSVGGGVSNLVSKLKGLYSVNPLLGVLVTMLGIGLPKALKNEAFRSSLSSIISPLGQIAQALVPVIARIAEVMAQIGSGILISILNILAPLLKIVADAISAIPTPVLTAIVTAIGGFLALKKVSPVLTSLTKGFTAFGAIPAKPIEAVGTAIGKFIIGVFKSLGNALPVIAKGAVAVALIGAAIGVFIAAVGGGIWVLGQGLQAVGSGFKSLAAGIQELNGADASKIPDVIEDLADALGGLFWKLGDFATAAATFGGIGRGLQEIAKGLVAMRDVRTKDFTKLKPLADGLKEFCYTTINLPFVKTENTLTHFQNLGDAIKNVTDLCNLVANLKIEDKKLQDSMTALSNGLKSFLIAELKPSWISRVFGGGDIEVKSVTDYMGSLGSIIEPMNKLQQLITSYNFDANKFKDSLSKIAEALKSFLVVEVKPSWINKVFGNYSEVNVKSVTDYMGSLGGVIEPLNKLSEMLKDADFKADEFTKFLSNLGEALQAFLTHDIENKVSGFWGLVQGSQKIETKGVLDYLDKLGSVVEALKGMQQLAKKSDELEPDYFTEFVGKIGDSLQAFITHDIESSYNQFMGVKSTYKKTSKGITEMLGNLQPVVDALGKLSELAKSFEKQTDLEGFTTFVENIGYSLQAFTTYDLETTYSEFLGVSRTMKKTAKSILNGFENFGTLVQGLSDLSKLFKEFDDKIKPEDFTDFIENVGEALQAFNYFDTEYKASGWGFEAISKTETKSLLTSLQNFSELGKGLQEIGKVFKDTELKPKDYTEFLESLGEVLQVSTFKTKESSKISDWFSSNESSIEYDTIFNHLSGFKDFADSLRPLLEIQELGNDKVSKISKFIIDLAQTLDQTVGIFKIERGNEGGGIGYSYKQSYKAEYDTVFNHLGNFKDFADSLKTLLEIQDLGSERVASLEKFVIDLAEVLNQSIFATGTETEHTYDKFLDSSETTKYKAEYDSIFGHLGNFNDFANGVSKLLEISKTITSEQLTNLKGFVSDLATALFESIFESHKEDSAEASALWGIATGKTDKKSDYDSVFNHMQNFDKFANGVVTIMNAIGDAKFNKDKFISTIKAIFEALNALMLEETQTTSKNSGGIFGIGASEETASTSYTSIMQYLGDVEKLANVISMFVNNIGVGISGGAIGDGSLFKTAMTNIAAGVKQIGDDWSQVFWEDIDVEVLKQLNVFLNDFKNTMTGWDTTQLTTQATNITAFFSSLVDTFSDTEKITAVAENAKKLGTQLVDTIVEGINSKKSDFVYKVQEFLTSALPEGFRNSEQNLTQSVQADIMDKIFKKMTDSGNIDTLKSVGKTIVQAIRDGFPDGYESLKTGVDGIVNTISEKFYEYTAKDGRFDNIGGYIIDGLIRGLNSKKGTLLKTANDIADQIATTIEKAQLVSSPSRRMFKIGGYIGEGLALGIESQVESVGEAAQELADAIRSPFEGLDDFTANITGSNNSDISGISHNTTINQNNIINNGTDYSTMMADLKWALFTA